MNKGDFRGAITTQADGLPDPPGLQHYDHGGTRRPGCRLPVVCCDVTRHPARCPAAFLGGLKVNATL